MSFGLRDDCGFYNIYIYIYILFKNKQQTDLGLEFAFVKKKDSSINFNISTASCSAVNRTACLNTAEANGQRNKSCYRSTPIKPESKLPGKI